MAPAVFFSRKGIMPEQGKVRKTLAKVRFDFDGQIVLYAQVLGWKTHRTISQLIPSQECPAE